MAKKSILKAAPKKKAAAPAKGKTIDKINQESEKSTLGDLEALTALKEKMSASNAAGASESESPKAE